MSTIPLMPKATAVWLIENTSLTFEQIADFCSMHILEIQGIADGEVARGIIGVNPMQSGQLTGDEILRCEKNPNARLSLNENVKNAILQEQHKKKKSKKYTPIARRQDKPNAIAWLLKHCPEMSDSAIAKLISTTKETIAAIKNKTYWNYGNLTPKDPVILGLCSQTDLSRAYDDAKITKKAEG